MPKYYAPFQQLGETEEFLFESLPEEGRVNINFQSGRSFTKECIRRRGCKADIMQQYAALLEPTADPLQILLENEEAGFNIWDH